MRQMILILCIDFNLITYNLSIDRIVVLLMIYRYVIFIYKQTFIIEVYYIVIEIWLTNLDFSLDWIYDAGRKI